MVKKKKHTEENREHYMKVLMEETDRGCVLSGFEFITGRLADLIRASMHAHFDSLNATHDEEKRHQKLAEGVLKDFNAPLGTASSKIVFARAYSLITEDCYKAIRYLKDIRNEFAHSKAIVRHIKKSSADELEKTINDPEFLQKSVEFIDLMSIASPPLKLSKERIRFLACCDYLLRHIRKQTKDVTHGHDTR